jgi:hypothetical protein
LVSSKILQHFGNMQWGLIRCSHLKCCRSKYLLQRKGQKGSALTLDPFVY